MQRLVIENTRLIYERESANVERDACVALLLQVAVAHGLKAGVANGNIAVLELPCGQVSWPFEESESHLLSMLPEYQNEIEEMDAPEKYRRVMNPGTL